MIKRRFYKQDHGDKSGSSDSSSSDDSDSEPELEAEEDHEVEEGGQEVEGNDNNEIAVCYQSPAGSGYESEDSSNNQGETDASGLLTNEEEGSDEDQGIKKERKTVKKLPKLERAPETLDITIDPNDPIQTEISSYILKCKSTFKCRLCPRVLCLNEATVRTHLASKRHTRSKKLLGEGRLKLMLNSDGELEEEQETHAERHARTLALAEEPVVTKKKSRGRQRQSHRRKKRMRSGSKKGNLEASVENVAKKRCRTD